MESYFKYYSSKYRTITFRIGEEEEDKIWLKRLGISFFNTTDLKMDDKTYKFSISKKTLDSLIKTKQGIKF